MNETVSTHPPSPQAQTSSIVSELESPAHSLSWMEKKARQIIFSQLKKLHTGVMTLHEGGRAYSFGKPYYDNEGREVIAELQINDPACYVNLLTAGSIGAAEAYMTADWSTPNLTDVVRIMVLNMDVLDGIEGGVASFISKPLLKIFHKFNENTEKGSRRNIAAHYDLGNDLFQCFLDERMMYSSAIFKDQTSTLEDASEYKLQRICDGLNIQATDHIIEIGSGWGGFALYAAKHYGCHVTTTTISEQQYALAKSRIKAAGLEDRITLLKEDYRQLSGKFDKLVSIEMIEAVGYRYYPTFFETCSRLLKDDGVMLIQAITIEDQRYDQARKNVDFIQRYIFPGSCIPSVHALLSASKQASDMRLSYQQDYAEHYALTLNEWHIRFNEQKEAILSLGYSEEFHRLWQFYFAYCEGGFKERSIGLSHLVFAKPKYREDATLRV